MKTEWDRIADAAWLQFSYEKEKEINADDYTDDSSAQNQSLAEGEFSFFLEPKKNDFGFHAAWDSVRDSFNTLNRKELKELSDKYFASMSKSEIKEFMDNRER